MTKQQQSGHDISNVTKICCPQINVEDDCSNLMSWKNLTLPNVIFLSPVFPYIARLGPPQLYLAFKADSTVSYTCFLPSLAPLKINAPLLFWAK